MAGPVLSGEADGNGANNSVFRFLTIKFGSSGVFLEHAVETMRNQLPGFPAS